MNAVGGRLSMKLRSRFTLCLAFSALAFCVFAPTARAKDAAKKVNAEYAINFNGIGIGTFKLWSDIYDKEYSLKARASISVLAGILFEWVGDTSSSGEVLAKLPRPYSYSFGYRTSDKRETIDVKFSNNIVQEIALNPPQKPSSARVPVTRNHMRNVVDPLSAVVMLTNISADKKAQEVCSRKLPIFDGKSRYDLKLSYKSTKTVNSSFGYNGPAYVCKVKFLPIAGHKSGDEESSFAAKNEGIEIWMIPLQQADLYVPYYINIPTPVGTASLISTGFSVEGGEAQRAMIR
jgi:hypothetical protein